MTNSSSQRRALVVQQGFSPVQHKTRSIGICQQRADAASPDRKPQDRQAPNRHFGHDHRAAAAAPDLLRQYKKQQLFELKILYGVESLDPEINQINASQLTQLIETLIPVDVCRRYRLIPLSRTDGDPPAIPPSVLVAMVNPDDLAAQDDLNRILRPQGLALQRMVITAEDYQRMISQFLDEQVERQRQMDMESRIDVKSDIENLDYLDLEDPADDDVNLDAALEDAEAAPVITLGNKILAKALQEGVSDIHIEPQEDHLRIRFRKDGVLRQG